MANVNEKFPGLGFHHMALKVADFEKSFKFYTEVIGMKHYATWGEGDSRISMLDIGDGTILELFAGGGNLPEKGIWLHLAVKTDNVDGLYEAALAGGAESVTPPADVLLNAVPAPLNVRAAFVRGFDGEEFEFFCLKD